MKGKIVIDAPIKTGMIKIGPHLLGTQDFFYSRTMWEVTGTFVVKGKVNIGSGSKICIGENATLTLGDNFSLTGNSEIICQKEISFGSNCLLSWDILIMDTDFHLILNADEQIINSPKPIIIGNHVWIGCKNTILKGVSIADNNIISANSTITRSITDSKTIIGGHGKSVEIIKRDVNWKL
jgi:acetyltransferase-like isoleucine patch superfamily enzyme